MAWFRLGGWRWQGKKGEDGKRLCPLCGELDGEFHILGECKELEGVREICEMGGKIRSWGWQHWAKNTGSGGGKGNGEIFENDKEG